MPSEEHYKFLSLVRRAKRDHFALTEGENGYLLKRAQGDEPARSCKTLVEVEAYLDDYRADWPEGFVGREQGVDFKTALAETQARVEARQAEDAAAVAGLFCARRKKKG